MHKTILLFFVLFFISCTDKQNNLQKNDSFNSNDCSMPEMTLKSCVEPDLDKIVSYPLGSKNNPVRAFMPTGQRAYLSSLKCENGISPKYQRLGSTGEGPYGFMLDTYMLKCKSKSTLKEKEYFIYMDMYHKGYVEKKAVDDFNIKKN